MPQRPRLRALRFWLPLLTINIAPFLIGSVFPWVQAALVLLLAIALVAELRVKGGAITPKAAYGLLGVLALTALGLVPLPVWLLGYLSPKALETREFVVGGLGAEFSPAPLSLSPLDTMTSLLLGVAVILAFLMGASMTSRKNRWRAVLFWVGSSGGVMALLVEMHQVIGLTAVYGLYPTKTSLVAPLINPNHLAALGTLSLLTALGLALHSSGKTRSWMVLSAGASLALISETDSRGGLAAMMIGLLGLIFLELWAWRGRRAVIGIGLGLLAVLGLAVSLLSVDALLAVGHQTQGDIKVTVWSDTLRMIGDFPWFGVGRRAFSAVFPRYQSFPEAFTVRSAEMLPLSIVSELGLVGLLVALVVGYLLLAPIRRRRLEPAARGALVGLLALALHDWADFSLDIMGVALPAALTAGVLCGRGEETRRSGAAYAALVSALLAVPLGLWASWRSSEAALARVQAAGTADEVRALALQELAWRPSDGYLALGAAARLLSLGSTREAMPFINRARYLLPMDSGSHLLAARALRVLRRYSQARLEYRAALPRAPREIYREALTIAPDEPSLRGLISGDQTAQQILAETLIEAKRYREALNLLWGAAEGTKDPERWERVGELALTAGAPEETLAASEVLRRLSDKRWPWLAARAYQAQKNPTAAQVALEEGTRLWPNEASLWLQLGELSLASNHLEAALDAGQQAKKLSGGRAEGAALEARALEAQGRLQSAAAAYREALDYAPRMVSSRIALARLYEKLGRISEAVPLYRDLIQEHPEFQADLDRLRHN